jgi:glycosyltransferase involved in cell wall biosynthesis
MKDDLFVGVTTWDSELFLEHCLRSIHNTTQGLSIRIGVVDNFSTDRSVEIARDLGAAVRMERCSRAIALNRLLSMSMARHTLLIHSDVILLSPDWYATCSGHLTGPIALVAPEDIGCGPLTRPYGAGMPESCFLLFDTAKAKRARTVTWLRRRRLPWPHLQLNLNHYYVTHNLPRTLEWRGYSWRAMKVHASPKEPEPIYTPPFTPEYWSDDLSYLRYAMGNFYSLDGQITHYHNWFDRVPKDVHLDSLETTERNGKGLPPAFLSLGTRRFIEDLEAGRLILPPPDERQPHPRETPQFVPDLTRPFSADKPSPLQVFANTLDSSRAAC